MENPVISFEGRPLTEWLWDLISSQVETSEKASKAIRGMGGSIHTNKLAMAGYQAALLKALTSDGFPTEKYLSELIAFFSKRGEERIAQLNKRDWRKKEHSPVLSSPFVICDILEAAVTVAGPVIPQLVKLIENAEPLVHSTAIKVLGGIRPSDDRDFESFFEKVSKRHETGQWSMHDGKNISNQASGHPSRIARVAEQAFHQTNPGRRRLAFETLGALGRQGLFALPETLKMTEEKGLDFETLSQLVIALGRLAKEAGEAEGKKVVERLIPLAKHPEWYVRANACWALGNIGRYPEKAVPAILPNVGDSEGYDFTPHGCAVVALKVFGPLAAPATPGVVSSLENSFDEWLGHWDDIELLGAIGPAASAALPVLKRAKADLVLRKQNGESLEREEAMLDKVISKIENTK
jgi:hypothetical protein